MTQEIEAAPFTQDQSVVYPAMSHSFNSYWPSLKKIMKERGRNWEETYGLDEQHPGRPVNMTKKEIKRLSKKVVLDLLAMRQATSARWVTMEADPRTRLGQALSCLRWYGPMVGAKFARIIYQDTKSGKLTANQPESPTIKLLHLILARAIAAATVVMQEREESVSLLLPLTLDYCLLLNYLRVNYPKAHLLQRTAFDNPRYAAELKSYYNGHLPIDPFRDNSWSAGGRAPSE